MPIELKDLKRGDIILYMPSWDSDSLLADHTGMVTRIDEEANECWVTHATTGRYKQVVETLLRPAEDTTFVIWRCSNNILAAHAANLLSSWSNKGINYSQVRSNLRYSIEDHFNLEVRPHVGLPIFLKWAEQSYQDNYFRIIKYAARRGLCVSKSKGLCCADVVVLAYQVAGVAEFIPDQEHVGVSWVTDKYSSDSYDSFIKDASYFEKFKAYRDRLRSPNEFSFFSQPTKQYAPRKEGRFSSIMIWNEEKYGHPDSWFLSPERVFTIDSKLATPSLLKYFMSQNPIHWKEIGVFCPERVMKTSEEKSQWLSRLEQRKKVTESIHEDVISRYSTPIPFFLDINKEEEIEMPDQDIMSPRLLRAKSMSLP